MKKGILFSLLFVFSFLFSIFDVKASYIENWYEFSDIIKSPRAYIYSFSGSSASNVGTTDITFIDDKTYTYYTNPSSSHTFGASGMGITFQQNQAYYDNYMYSLSMYVCNAGDYLPTNYSDYIFTIANTATSYNVNTATVYYQNYKDVSPNVSDDASFGVCRQYNFVFRSNGNYMYSQLKLMGTGQSAYGLSFFGYSITSLGYANNLSDEEISNIISSSGLASAESVEDVQISINQVQEEINGMQEEQQQTNDKLDDITNMDIPDSSKEDLDDSSYQDYQGAEDDLMDSVGEADLSSVDIAIDGDSSNFIWDTITDFFQSHPLIMSTVIAILSIGIIKLALGR